MVDILGRSEYPQHVKILRQGVGAWRTSLTYMDVQRGSLVHGGHLWIVYIVAAC